MVYGCRGKKGRKSLATASREDAVELSPIVRPIPADKFDSELVRDGRDDGDTFTVMTPLLTERDAAVRLRVTLNDLNAILENGELPYSVIGGQLRITDDDIRNLVSRTRTQGSTLPIRCVEWLYWDWNRYH